MSTLVDVHIGKRLRGRRRSLGLTQVELAAACGIRFQQVHKYETAANHISAAMLWRLALALDVRVQYFYDGLDPSDTSTAAAGRSFAAGSPGPAAGLNSSL